MRVSSSLSSSRAARASRSALVYSATASRARTSPSRGWRVGIAGELDQRVDPLVVAPGQRAGGVVAHARVRSGGAGAAASRARRARRGWRTRSRSSPAPRGPLRGPRAPRGRPRSSAGRVRRAPRAGRARRRRRAGVGIRLAGPGQRDRVEHLAGPPATPGRPGRRPLLLGVPLAHRERQRLTSHVALGQPRVEPEVGEGRVGAAPEPVLGGHPAAAGGLDLEELQRASVAVADQAVPSVRTRPPAGARVSPSTRAAQTPRNPSSGSRRRAPMWGGGRARRGPAARAAGSGPAGGPALDLLGVGHAGLGLLGEGRALVERPDEQVPAALPQPPASVA